MSLSEESCEVCRVGAPKVSDAEAQHLLNEIPKWQIQELQGVHQLVRVFEFKNFKEALAFTNAVGDIAEEAKHHPALLTEWGKVTVNWWTHKIEGLHRNDFVMAAKTDALL